MRRRRNAKDDRIVENWLTDAGHELKSRAARVPVQLLCSAGLGMDELESLRSALGGLIVTLRKLPT